MLVIAAALLVLCLVLSATRRWMVDRAIVAGRLRDPVTGLFEPHVAAARAARAIAIALRLGAAIDVLVIDDRTAFPDITAGEVADPAIDPNDAELAVAGSDGRVLLAWVSRIDAPVHPGRTRLEQPQELVDVVRRVAPQDAAEADE